MPLLPAPMSKPNATRPLRETVALCLDDWGVHSDRDESDSDDFCGWHVGSRVEEVTPAAATTLPDAAAAADAMGATVLGEVILNMNRAWGDMEMAILRDYAARTAARTPLVLVANGPVHHRGGKVHRRLRDALYELTALCRTHPRAHILTLMTDPAIRWPRRQEFERLSLSWPDSTDHGAIELAIFDERPPLIVSVFQRTEAPPHPNAHAVCYHGLLPPLTQMPAAADFAEWRGRPFDVVYVGNDRTVAYIYG